MKTDACFHSDVDSELTKSLGSKTDVSFLSDLDVGLTLTCVVSQISGRTKMTASAMAMLFAK